MFDAIEAGANAESVGPDTLALFLFVDDECRSRLHALLSQFPAMASAVEEEAKALEAQGLRRRE